MKKIYDGPHPGGHHTDWIKTFKKGSNTPIVYTYENKPEPWAAPDKCERFDWSKEMRRTAFSVSYTREQAGNEFEF